MRLLRQRYFTRKDEVALCAPNAATLCCLLRHAFTADALICQASAGASHAITRCHASRCLPLPPLRLIRRAAMLPAPLLRCMPDVYGAAPRMRRCLL